MEYNRAARKKPINREKTKPQTAAVIDHFTVVCSVAWPLNGSEAGVHLVLIEYTAFIVLIKLFLC